MKPFTMKQYEESLNKLEYVKIFADNGDWIITHHGNKAGTCYRNDYPELFKKEYEFAIKDNDLIYMVTGKYPE